MADKNKIGKLESALRGAYYGGIKQPVDVLGSFIARQARPDLFEDFDSALSMAKEKSLSGSQGEALRQNPNWFEGGQLAGQIASAVIPATGATKVIGAAAPALSKAGMIGRALGSGAKAIGAGRGLIGVPASGAVQGAVGGLMSEGDAGTGAAGGALANSVFGLGGKLIKPFANNVGSAAKQGFENTLKKIGIDDLTIGQKTGSKGFQLVDSVLSQLPFTAGAARDRAEGQLTKFTQAAMQKAGINADKFTPTVREAAEKNFGSQYKNLIKNETIKIDDPVLEKVGEIAAKQMDKLPTNVKPMVQSYLRDIVQSGGKLSGEAYQAARSQLTNQARSIQMSDSYTAGILKDLRNTLDEAAERSLPKAKKGAWSQLNNQYRNYKTLQKAGSRVSEDSLEGIISPSALMNAVETANKTKGQAGYGDLYDLARAGRSSLVDSVPNSGTAQRQLVQSLLTGGGVGAGTYGLTQDPQMALAAGAGTIALPKMAQSFINSKAG